MLLQVRFTACRSRRMVFMLTRPEKSEYVDVPRRTCNRPKVIETIAKQFNLTDGVLHRYYMRSKSIEPVVGFKVGPYMYAKVAGIVTPVHNIVAILSTGYLIPEGMVCDHIDGNPMNNHASNIRVVTSEVNSQNTIRRCSAATGRRNIVEKRGRYFVAHKVSGQLVRVGTFSTIEEAIEARNESFAMYAPEKLACIHRRGE